jgi:hypothetical protein
MFYRVSIYAIRVDPDRGQSDSGGNNSTGAPNKSGSKQNEYPASIRVRWLLFGVVGSCLAVALLIATATPNIQDLYQNWTIEITSASATAISIFAYLRLRRTAARTDHARKMGLALMLGLISLFMAENIWNYYVYVLDVEIPYPSAADIFYLAGYPCLACYLYWINNTKKSAERENEQSKFIGTAVVITIVAFVVNLFLLQIVESSIGFSELLPDELLTLGLSMAYPILDAILLIPSIIILYSSVRYNQGITAANGIMFASAMILNVIADIGFGYVAVNQIQELSGQSTWDILYSCMYILISGSLVSSMVNYPRINPWASCFNDRCAISTGVTSRRSAGRAKSFKPF